jgi:hypothetical protein
MVDLERAESYVRLHGDAVQIARLIAILQCEPPTESALRELAKLQDVDGGYRCRGRETGNLFDTARVLQWLDDLGVHTGPLVGPACRFLIDHQLEDGGWDEAPEPRDLGVLWQCRSSDVGARVWLTGLCAHVLIRFGYAEAPGTRCPTDFLLAHCDRTGRMEGSLRATWNALPMLAFYPGSQSPPFRRAVKAVEDAYEESWAGGYVASLLRCLWDSGLHAGHRLVERVLGDLQRAQREDGSWKPDSGERDADGVHATIAAVKALRIYERL